MAVHAALTVAILLSAAALLPDAPSGGPAAVVDDRSPAAAAPSATATSPSATATSPSATSARPRATAAPSSPWQWPVRPSPLVVTRFAVGPHRWSPGHRGVDLAAPPGVQALAAGGGLVTFAGPLAGRGVVVVAHPNGIRTTYEPVLAQVRRGQRVSAGQVIGVLEASGSHCPTGCLHWGAIRGRTYLDPLGLVARRAPPVLLPLLD